MRQACTQTPNLEPAIVQAATNAAIEILQIPVLNDYMIPEMAEIIGRYVDRLLAAEQDKRQWKVVPVKRQSGEVWTGLGDIDCGGGRLLGSMNEQVALAVVAAHNGKEASHE